MWPGMERRDFLGVGPQRPAEFAQEGDEGQASRWDSNKGEEVAMGQRLSVEALLPGGNGMRGPEMPQGAEICLAGLVGSCRGADGWKELWGASKTEAMQ